MTISFDPGSETGRQLLRWHQRLIEDPGERAALRRAHDPLDAVLSPSFHRLAAALPSEIDSRRLTYIATLLARVDTDEPGRNIAQACNGPVSEARFRRLVESSDRDDLHHQLRGILQLLGRRANLLDLANTVYFWGDARRRRWATDYYTRAST